MGTPGFAVPPLKRLIEAGHQVMAVVTQPDRPSGRGKKVHLPPVKELALEHAIPVLQPTKLRNAGFDQVLKVYDPDVIVVAAYGRILPPEILTLPRHGCINIHASLLPRYRGAAPIQWAVINGERKTGVTIMRMDEGLDTGDIIATEEVEILDDDDTQSVANMLSVIGAEALLKVLARIGETGRVDGTPQNHDEATLAPILKKADGLLDWTMTNEEIICHIRGLQPWPAAFSFFQGQPWKFLRAEPFDDPGGVFTGGRQGELDPGRVTAVVKGRGFTVRTGDGHLLMTVVQPAGKKPMSGVDVINGQLLKKSDGFVSDPAFLLGEE